MKLVHSSFEIMNCKKDGGLEALKIIERAGRTCYKSEDKITDESAIGFVQMLIDRGHEAMLEHYHITAKVICDRGVSHEIVRHRIASYAQESTRYCNYGSEKFGGELTFVVPSFINKITSDYPYKIAPGRQWYQAMESAEALYMSMIDYGMSPQDARSVLPNSLKTEIIITMNAREWRHFFRLRTAKDAHPDMRVIASLMLVGFKDYVPVLFDDIQIDLNGENKGGETK